MIILSFSGRRRGQTMVEMLVMLTIVTLLSSTLIFFNKKTQGEKELFEEARKLVIDLRTAQDLAFSMADVGGETPCGYGIQLSRGGIDGYELFIVMAALGRDCADVQNGAYRNVPVVPGGAISEPVVRFKNLQLYSYTSDPVIFVPPYPRTLFFPPSDTASFQFINPKAGNQSIAEIELNKAGQITLKEP